MVNFGNPSCHSVCSHQLLPMPEEGISLLDSTAEIYFPSALVFKINAESQSDITKIRLHYQVDKMNYAQVISEAWPDFTPAPRVETKWVWDMRKASLPAGATVKYWWTIEDKAGDKLITPDKVISFDDLRYSWQKLTVGQLSLFWYKGSQSFARGADGCLPTGTRKAG